MSVTKLFALLALTITGPAFGQGFDAGVKIGIPFTQFFETGANGGLMGSAEYSSGTRRYTFGLSGEWRLTHAFGFELDAMFHRLGYTATVTHVGDSEFNRSVVHVSGDAWDFPLLAKYRFGWVIRPYVAAGGTLRYIGPVHGQGEQTNFLAPTPITTPDNTNSPADFNNRFYSGVIAAGGVEFGVGRVRVLPEVRYSRWTANISGPTGVLRFAPNQIECLVGIDF